jgi:alpha-beta hydrolase superfamily lysophospholipase
MKRKRWIRIIQWVIIIYALAGIGLYYLQDLIIFRSDPLPADYKYQFEKPFEEINIPYDQQSNINIIRFTVADSLRRGAILYFHGNRSNINYYAPYADIFLEKNYEVWMVDFPGYGKSTGPLAEKIFYSYAEQLYKIASREVSSDSIILYGKSLGSGIAVYIAAKFPAQQLILETPYYSFTSMAATYFPIYPIERMLRFKIPTFQFIKDVSIPITIFHGTADRTILLSNAQKLKPLLKSSDRFIIIPDGKHNGLPSFPAYRNVIDSLLR